MQMNMQKRRRKRKLSRRIIFHDEYWNGDSLDSCYFHIHVQTTDFVKQKREIINFCLNFTGITQHTGLKINRYRQFVLLIAKNNLTPLRNRTSFKNM